MNKNSTVYNTLKLNLSLCFILISCHLFWPFFLVSCLLLSVPIVSVLVSDQLDTQFLLHYVYINPLHVSSNSVLILRRTIVLIQLLLLLQLYNSLWVLACSIISFHCFLSCTLCFKLFTPIFLRSFLASSSHLNHDLPFGLY
jgi:uncharacterized membrane protein YkgB